MNVTCGMRGVLLAACLLATAGSAPLAQEREAAPPAETSPPPPERTGPEPAPPVGDDPALAPEPAAGERVGADNNISFPVDI